MSIPDWYDTRENAPGEVAAGQLGSPPNYHSRSLQRFANNQQWLAGDSGSGYDGSAAPIYYQNYACFHQSRNVSRQNGGGQMTVRVTFVREHDLLYYSCKGESRLAFGDPTGDEEDVNGISLESVSVHGARVIDLASSGIEIGEVYWLESTETDDSGDVNPNIRWAIEWPGSTRLILPKYIETNTNCPIEDLED